MWALEVHLYSQNFESAIRIKGIHLVRHRCYSLNTHFGHDQLISINFHNKQNATNEQHLCGAITLRVCAERLVMITKCRRSRIAHAVQLDCAFVVPLILWNSPRTVA